MNLDEFASFPSLNLLNRKDLWMKYVLYVCVCIYTYRIQNNILYSALYVLAFQLMHKQQNNVFCNAASLTHAVM